MKILVTGGAGFIGSAFIKRILANYPNYKITNLDALTYSGNLETLESIENSPNYSFVKGDICNKILVDEIVQDVDTVVNFAAESHVDRSILNPEIFLQTNVLGTMNLLEATKKHNIKRFIQISTDEVYGELGATGYFTEETPIKPNSPYSASKASADLLAMSYFRTYQTPVIITRCSNNYGPYQYPEKLIPYFILNILKDKKVPVYGDGLNVRDWLFVDDHCAAIDLVLHNGKIGEVYNIGGNNEKTNLEITKIVLEAFGKNEDCIEFVKDRLGHDKRYAICADKISRELGFEPTVNFEEGIKNTINWYANNQDWISNVLNKEGK